MAPHTHPRAAPGANGLGPAHWLAEGQQDLSAQHVEIAGWGGAVHHNPVAVIELAHLEVLGEHLQWTLAARGGSLHLGSTPRLGRAGGTHRVGIGVIITHLQEPLWPCRRVLRTLEVCVIQTEPAETPDAGAWVASRSRLTPAVPVPTLPTSLAPKFQGPRRLFKGPRGCPCPSS